MKKLLIISIALIAALIFSTATFGAGVALGGSGLLFEPGVVRSAEQPTEFDTFWQAWNIVQDNFVDRDALDTTKLTYGAITGMLTALGDEGHTAFLSPEEIKRQRSDISGKFSGIGATIGKKEGLPVIIAPMDGTPADLAGVKAGDIIIEVDGEDVTTLSINDIVEKIRGKEGTEVVLTLLRTDEGESVEITIVRGEIDVPSVTWNMLPGTSTAMVRLSQFSADATDDMKAAISEAEAAGATSLVLDMRSNPGGLLEQAISVTSQFLTDGNVLQQEDAAGNRTPYPVEEGGVATEIPMVVLINRGTASSAEIFAGAMQDHERAQVVGETTFGTGTVLEPFMLRDGSGIMLGTSQWLTADGRLIRKQGIEPDVEVELPIGTDFLYPAALEELTVEEMLQSEDTQVLTALELLDELPEK